MNTIVTFGVVLVALIVALVITGGDPSSPWLMVSIVAAIGAVTGIIFYPVSRTLWSAIDLLIVPLEPGEVDPRFDPSVSLDKSDAE